MKAIFEKIENFIKMTRRVLIISGIGILTLAVVTVMLLALSHSQDSAAVEAGMAAESTTEETMEVRVSVIRNGVQSGKLVGDENETNGENLLPYKNPRAVGEGEVQKAIAARAAEKAEAKAKALEEEKKRLEEEEKAAAEEEKKKTVDEKNEEEQGKEPEVKEEEPKETPFEPEDDAENSSDED